MAFELKSPNAIPAAETYAIQHARFVQGAEGLLAERQIGGDALGMNDPVE